jgi:hypothetical protein
MSQVDHTVLNELKEGITLGMLKAFKEDGSIDQDVQVETALGTLTFKTRPTDPDHVTRILLGPNRLYKIMTTDDQSRGREELTAYVEKKLDRESFFSQVVKVTNL